VYCLACVNGASYFDFAGLHKAVAARLADLVALSDALGDEEPRQTLSSREQQTNADKATLTRVLEDCS
jgi:hypothetical protein